MEKEHQKTVGGEIECAGIGLHRGRECRLVIKPAPADSGFVFEYKKKRIKAVASNIKNTARNMELAAGRESIFTVEHVLSALYGMGIDNALIEMDSPEPPALDGSSEQIARTVEELGYEVLDKARRYVEIGSVISAGGDGVYIICLPAERFEATYLLDYGHPMAGRQVFHFDGTPESYLLEVAPARTFGFIEEVDALRKAGLAAGGSTDNAVVVYSDSYSSELRYPEEFARHKMLDLIGDISLLGCARLRARVIAVRSGHSLNARLVSDILAAEKNCII